MIFSVASFLFFFFNDTATTEIYTLSLHDALPIYADVAGKPRGAGMGVLRDVIIADTDEQAMALWRDSGQFAGRAWFEPFGRSEEHTSELQSRQYLVCRLLLEKKKKQRLSTNTPQT